MTIKPKKNYPRPVHLAAKESPAKYCENPQCGAKLPKNTRKEQKYCDRACRDEHRRIQAIERRPKQVLCSFCQKPLDTMRASPSHWKKHTVNFCDEICADGYHRQTGYYQEISKKGREKAAEYKDKHGQVIGYEDRRDAVSENNKKAPPKAKHFIREGKVWGYSVKFYPDEDGNGYRVDVPELIDELGPMKAKTVKGGLKMVRERILELRAKEAKGETDVRN
jgi:hypothetical protein